MAVPGSVAGVAAGMVIRGRPILRCPAYLQERRPVPSRGLASRVARAPMAGARLNRLVASLEVSKAPEVVGMSEERVDPVT